MRHAKIRTWLVVVLAVLAAASMFPSFGGSSHPSVPPARHITLVAKHPGDRSAEHPTPVRNDP
jgi:hypothetical protein